LLRWGKHQVAIAFGFVGESPRMIASVDIRPALQVPERSSRTSWKWRSTADNVSPKTVDRETAAHQFEAGGDPGQERSLGGKVDSRILFRRIINPRNYICPQTLAVFAIGS
jgi:hypothetical protein